MIKCPSCGKRVQGADLLSGICSHCQQSLNSDSSSAGDSKNPFDQQVRDSSISNRVASHPIHLGDSSSGARPMGSAEELGNAATYVSEENVVSAASDDQDDDESKGTHGVSAASSSDLSQASDELPLDSSSVGSPHEAQRPDTNFDSGYADQESNESAATYLSDESPEEILDTAEVTDEVDDPSQRTIVTEGTIDDDAKADDLEAHLKTFVVQALPRANAELDADKTFISDEVPEGLLKTIESVWGSLEEAVPSQHELRPVAKSPNADHGHRKDDLSKKTSQQTQSLIIKTRAFADSVPKEAHAARISEAEPEYELLQILGEGGMGVVYDARQTSIDRNVAVKMLKAKSADNQKQRSKFLAEAVVTGDLDHPNIVPIYDVGANSDGALFYSMKKVQGTPWLKVIKRKSIPENLEILMKIADAVGFAHARGVVHRDLKPENVMLGEFGEVLVMDWGLAQPSKLFRKSRSITETNTMGGTPAYMAPEMATGPIDRIGPASDVYLLGAMLFEILTGGPPHVAKNAMKCLMSAARNEIAATDKSGELIDIARHAMATNPDDRYHDVKSFQAAIRDYQSHSESVLLSSRAHDELRSASQTGNYETYSKSVFGFQQAIELWDGNKGAVTGLAQAKLEYAGSAFRKGDLDLSLSLLDEQNPDHVSLLEELWAAKKDRVARQKRLVFLRRMASGLLAAVFLIVVGASIWIRSEQMKALLEANRATNEAIRATKAEKLAVQEKENALNAALAETAAKNAAIKAQQEALRQQSIAVAERNKAELAKLKEEYESYISKIGLAASQIDKNAFDAARQVLESCKLELRNWEWGRLTHLTSQSTRR